MCQCDGCVFLSSGFWQLSGLLPKRVACLDVCGVCFINIKLTSVAVMCVACMVCTIQCLPHQLAKMGNNDVLVQFEL